MTALGCCYGSILSLLWLSGDASDLKRTEWEMVRGGKVFGIWSKTGLKRGIFRRNENFSHFSAIGC